jgi:apolipoprotein N-acyltransferase
VGTEYLRAEILTGFPWCLLGYGLVDAVNLSQAARWTGVYGLSFVSISVSAFAAEVLVRPSRFAVFRLFGVASVLLGLTLGFSWIDRTPSPPANWVHIVQTNIDLDQKLDPAARASLLDELAQLSVPSERLELNPESKPVLLILWPETPAAFYFNHDRDFRRRMESIATSAGGYFLFGFVDFRAHAKDDLRQDPNSVATLGPDNEQSVTTRFILYPLESTFLISLFFFVDKILTEAETSSQAIAWSLRR